MKNILFEDKISDLIINFFELNRHFLTEGICNLTSVILRLLPDSISTLTTQVSRKALLSAGGGVIISFQNFYLVIPVIYLQKSHAGCLNLYDYLFKNLCLKWYKARMRILVCQK